MQQFKIPIKWNYRLESKFTTEYLKQWSELWNWWYKISDMARTIKPTDTILGDSTWLYIVEFKMIDGDMLHIGNKFEPSQMKAWRAVSWLCNKALAIVYSIKRQDYVVIDFTDICDYKDAGVMEMRLFS